MAKVQLSEIPGVILRLPSINADERGTFTKYFERDLTRTHRSESCLNSLSVATNIEAGTLRGLHFQVSPFEEEKVIICIRGRIFDAIVDLREGSPTMGKWASVELNEDQPSSLFLPKGIAHGYQTLTTAASVFYGLSSEHRPDNAFSLLYSDTGLNISWPLPVSQISLKDSQGISLIQALAAVKGIY